MPERREILVAAYELESDAKRLLDEINFTVDQSVDHIHIRLRDQTNRVLDESEIEVGEE